MSIKWKKIMLTKSKYKATFQHWTGFHQRLIGTGRNGTGRENKRERFWTEKTGRDNQRKRVWPQNPGCNDRELTGFQKLLDRNNLCQNPVSFKQTNGKEWLYNPFFPVDLDISTGTNGRTTRSFAFIAMLYRFFPLFSIQTRYLPSIAVFLRQTAEDAKERVGKMNGNGFGPN